MVGSEQQKGGDEADENGKIDDEGDAKGRDTVGTSSRGIVRHGGESYEREGESSTGGVGRIAKTSTVVKSTSREERENGKKNQKGEE